MELRMGLEAIERKINAKVGISILSIKKLTMLTNAGKNELMILKEMLLKLLIIKILLSIHMRLLEKIPKNYHQKKDKIFLKLQRMTLKVISKKCEC